MTRRVNVDVDVDLSDFDDDEIFAEANSRGLEHLSAPAVSDLAFAISRGDESGAMIALEALVSGQRALVDAIDMGRRRHR